MSHHFADADWDGEPWEPKETGGTIKYSGQVYGFSEVIV
jgi:hypothetical protein